MNSGSFFIIIAGLICLKVTYYIINKIAVLFAHYKFSRLVGIYFYTPSLLNDLKNEILKLFIKSYFDLALCSFLNMFAFFEKTKD